MHASRSPRCPSSRCEVPSSASADVHGAPMVVWTGAGGGGPVAAGLLGCSFAAEAPCGKCVHSTQLQVWACAPTPISSNHPGAQPTAFVRHSTS